MSTLLLIALAAGVLALVCLLLMSVLVRELRRHQHLLATPRLVLDIEADDHGTPAVTVTNAGNGPALDATLTVAFEERDPEPGHPATPPGLPHRFHAARLLPPGAQVRFAPPGDPGGYLAADVLSVWVRGIHLTGTATDLRGRPVTIHDTLTDPFRRVQAVLDQTAAGPASPPTVASRRPATVPAATTRRG